MTQARVLIVDNDPRVGRDLAEILRPEGYEVKIVQRPGAKVAAAAKAAALRFRPHIAIVDLRLINDYDTADRSGLGVLRSMSSANCILYTSFLSLDLVRELAPLASLRWISKGERPDKLLEAIRLAVQLDGLDRKPPKLKGLTSQQVVQALFGKNTTVSADSVDIVIRRLFPHARKIVLDPLLHESGNSPAVSRSHSVVLRALVDDLEPMVVKLAPAKQIYKEYANYQKVSRRLVGRFLASFEGTAQFWDLGGGVYSLLGSSHLQSLHSFETYYGVEEKPERVLKPLAHLFGEVWGKLYGKTKCCRSRTTLFQRYDRAFHFHKHLQELGAGERGLSLPALAYPLANPVRWVLEHREESLIDDARMAITHGDLHAQNLFVDGEHAWTIDFERAGLGHGLRDFIELETDIATRLARFPEDDLTSFFRFAVPIAALSEPKSPHCRPFDMNPDAQKALGIIDGIRKLAYEATKYRDPREYLWGLLLNDVFVGSLADERSFQRQRAIILASVLCERLSRWGQEWPPADWLPALQDQSSAQA